MRAIGKANDGEEELKSSTGGLGGEDVGVMGLMVETMGDSGRSCTYRTNRWGPGAGEGNGISSGPGD